MTVQPFESGISVPGYQEVGIRIAEYQAEKEVPVWSPDFLVPSALISWSPDPALTRLSSLPTSKNAKK
jgi:hypothetical protein